MPSSSDTEAESEPKVAVSYDTAAIAVEPHESTARTDAPEQPEKAMVDGREESDGDDTDSDLVELQPQPRVDRSPTTRAIFVRRNWPRVVAISVAAVVLVGGMSVWLFAGGGLSLTDRDGGSSLTDRDDDAKVAIDDEDKEIDETEVDETSEVDSRAVVDSTRGAQRLVEAAVERAGESVSNVDAETVAAAEESAESEPDDEETAEEDEPTPRRSRPSRHVGAESSESTGGETSPTGDSQGDESDGDTASQPASPRFEPVDRSETDGEDDEESSGFRVEPVE